MRRAAGGTRPGWRRGLLLSPGPSPFSFCLHASLGVEAGGSGAELVQRRLLQTFEGWGKTLSPHGTRLKPQAAAPAHAAPSRSHSSPLPVKPDAPLWGRGAALAGGAGRIRGRAGGGGRSHGPGIWAGRDAPRAFAGCGARPPAAASFLRPGRGGAAVAGGWRGTLAAREGALRCGRGGPDPRVPAPRRPAQPRNRKVHASHINFWGPRHSPERGASAPTPGEEPGESPVGTLLARFFGGQQQPFRDPG